MLNNKPLSIVIISCLLMLSGLLCILQQARADSLRKTLEAQGTAQAPGISLEFVSWYFGTGTSIFFIAAGALFMGWKWARIFYILGHGILILVNFLIGFWEGGINPFNVILPLLMYATFIFFLHRPRANEFFKSKVVTQ